jgi:hypothetical protein
MAVEVAMGFLTLPAVIVIIMLPGFTSADTLADFGRFAAAEGDEVAVVDMFGAERLGRIVAATDTNVTMGFGAGTHTFARADVLKADRLRDSNLDGLLKGVAVGALVGWMAAMELGAAHGFSGSIAVYGSIGLLLDNASKNREPLYRTKP